MPLIRACALDDLPVGSMKRIEGQRPVLVANTSSGVFAVEDRCSHADARLSAGQLLDDTIACPAHWWTFSLESGETLYPAKRRCIRTFRTVIDDGVIWVDTDMPAAEAASRTSAVRTSLESA